MTDEHKNHLPGKSSPPTNEAEANAPANYNGASGSATDKAAPEPEASEQSLTDQLRQANENLIRATKHAQSMTELAEQVTKQMSFLAQHDFLTGLPNRSLLNDRLSQAIIQAQRHHKKVALLFLDLDHFKHINDTLGHGVGDQLLQAVAKRLQAWVRHSDTI